MNRQEFSFAWNDESTPTDTGEPAVLIDQLLAGSLELGCRELINRQSLYYVPITILAGNWEGEVDILRSKHSFSVSNCEDRITESEAQARLGLLRLLCTRSDLIHEAISVGSLHMC